MNAFRLLLCFLLLVPEVGFGLAMETALRDAAQNLSKTRLVQHLERAIIIEVVNRHSRKRDQTAQAIEVQLYLALERSFPDFQLIFIEESLTGVNLDKAIFLQGTYERSGGQVKASFRALIGRQGEIAGQTQVEFDAPTVVKESLVAVLDVEAPRLSSGQRRAFSEIFRGELARQQAFPMASSGDVAKMDPDAIQKVYQCTRDECATLIGEQLGVDRVLSTSIIQTSDQTSYLTAKLMSIEDRSIIATVTIEHQGSSTELRTAATGLAKALIQEFRGEVARVKATEGVGWEWHATALGMAAIAVYQARVEADNYARLADENQQLTRNYQETSSVTERESIQAKYDKNKKTMEEKQLAVQVYNGLSALFLGWEAYLLWSDLEKAENYSNIKRGRGPDLLVLPSRFGGTKVDIGWRF